MNEITTVVLTKPATGGVAFLRPDGSYVLAEQLDAKPLIIGQKLSGHMDSVGVEQLTDVESRDVYGIFVQAYGLALSAVQAELS